jgi:hypothetical protein
VLGSGLVWKGRDLRESLGLDAYMLSWVLDVPYAFANDHIRYLKYGSGKSLLFPASGRQWAPLV